MTHNAPWDCDPVLAIRIIYSLEELVQPRRDHVVRDVLDLALQLTDEVMELRQEQARHHTHH